LRNRAFSIPVFLLLFGAIFVTAILEENSSGEFWIFIVLVIAAYAVPLAAILIAAKLFPVFEIKTSARQTTRQKIARALAVIGTVAVALATIASGIIALVKH
jgi:Kef-type K+ transport system membrane component KefB